MAAEHAAKVLRARCVAAQRAREDMTLRQRLTKSQIICNRAAHVRSCLQCRRCALIKGTVSGHADTISVRACRETVTLVRTRLDSSARPLMLAGCATAA